MKNREKARTRPFRHVLLEGNKISGCVRSSVDLSAADGPVVR